MEWYTASSLSQLDPVGQGSPLAETSLSGVLAVHRFLVLLNVLQSIVSGQVTSVGMLMCVAKQNRCRKICQSEEEGWSGRY